MMNPLRVQFGVLLLLLATGNPGAWGQEGGVAPPLARSAAESRAAEPLPDIPALMRMVEANERTSETVEKDYIYRQFTQMDENDSKGKLKKRTTSDAEIFWLDGVQVRRVLKRDGKELTAEEKQKEDAQIDKRVAEAKVRRAKADAEGKETDSRGREEITVARMLELGTFSNERRATVNGRSTIIVDYTGDPHAKTHNAFEGVFRELGGTVWVDERDKAIERVEGRFLDDFKLGGGLLVDLHKGTSFQATFSKVNDEVWLPDAFAGQGSVRAMLFLNLHGSQVGHNSDYRKFKATSTILPAITEVEPSSPEPDVPPQPEQSTFL